LTPGPGPAHHPEMARSTRTRGLALALCTLLPMAGRGEEPLEVVRTGRCGG